MFGRLLKRRTKELHDKAFEYKQCPEKSPTVILPDKLTNLTFKFI